MEHQPTRLGAFVIVEREGKILLTRRYNTGYADGQYQIPAGHIHSDEYPTEAAIREAQEELGIDISTKDVMFVHARYRINHIDTTGDNVDYFFKVTQWVNEPYNAEPEECDEIMWVSYDELPPNLILGTREVLECIRAGVSFSETGKLA